MYASDRQRVVARAAAAVWLAGVALCVGAVSGVAAAQQPSTVPKIPGLVAPERAEPALGPPRGATQTSIEVPGSVTETVIGPDVIEAEAACVGKPIADVALVGCTATRCEPKFVQERMRSLSDLHPGNRVRNHELALASHRFMSLGMFRAVTVSCLVDATGGARIAFSVVGNNFVRRIEFEGNKAIFTDELRSRSLIRPGDVLNADTPDGLNLMDRQGKSVESQYQRNGYDNAKATVTVRQLQPGELLVRVAIDEGERQRVTGVRALIDDLPPATAAEDAADLVCPRVGERALLAASEMTGTEVFTRRQADKARLRVRNFLRRLGFPSPTVLVRHETDGTVTIQATPGRCHLVRILTRDDVGSDSAAGYSISDDKALYEVLPFAESGLFDFDEADRGRQDLSSAMENRGFLFADIKLDYRPVPKSLGSQVETAITYYVTTGYVSQVRGIAFPGQQQFDSGRLRSVLTTKAYDFFDTGGFAHVDQLLSDLEALRQFYRDAGFYQFQYDLALPESETPTAAGARKRLETKTATLYQYRFANKGFQIRKPRGETFIYVDIPVTEGGQTRLSALRIDGASQVAESEVRQLLKLAKGDVISPAILTQAVRAVEQRYHNAGFFRMSLASFCASRNPAHKELACNSENMLAAEVDLRIVVTEGEQVEVGEVFVTGNFQTTEEVILRDMPRAGTPFAEDTLFEAQRRLRNLGIFAQVSLQYIGRDENPPRHRLAVVVQVVENQNRYIEGAAGFQTVNTQRATATKDQGGRVISAGEVESAPGVVDAIGHAVSSADRLTMGFGQAVGLTLPNLLFIGEAGYVDRNFLSTGKELRLPIKIGGNTAPAYVQCRAPTGGKDVVGALALAGSCPGDDWWDKTLSYTRFFSALPSYYDSRLLGSDFGLRLTGYAVHDYAIQAIDIDKYGLLTELQRRFGKLATSFGIDVGLIRSKRPEEPDFTTTGGMQPQLQVIPRLTYDGTDSPLNPTRGFFVTAALPLIDTIIKVPNAADCPTANTCRPQTYSFPQVRFVKWEVTGKAFFTLGSSLTLAWLAHVGYGQSIEKIEPSATALPQPERYRLGGQFGLRGFADYGVRQYDSAGCTLATRPGVSGKVPIGQKCADGLDHPAQVGDVLAADGNVVANGSVEARFPLARDQGVWGSVFWDFGAIAEHWTGEAGGLHTGSFRSGLGVGLRWLLSGQIPVRVDYGVAIGKRCRDLPAGSEECVEDDVGRLHFGLLYSF